MYQILHIKIIFAAIGLLLLAKCTLQQTFTLSQPATGPSITCNGSDVTLQCVILLNGVPVNIIWRRNGTLVDTNVLTNHQYVFNSTYNAFTDLVITNVGLEDDNTEYECTITTNEITSSIVLNVTGPPSVKIVNGSSSICYVSVMWSSSRTEICGTINYAQFINNGRVVKNLNATTSEISMVSLTPDTNYTFKVAAMDSAGAGMYMEEMFNTGKPTAEIFTATWQCNETNFCGILANWMTITETDEICAPIEKLELQGLNASSDNVAVDNAVTTTRSYTALIPVDQLINNTVLIATYCNGAVTRSSDQINTIDGSNFLLQDLDGEILFKEQITVKANWKGATNLGIVYRISLICNNSYMQENSTVDILTANFTLPPQSVTADNIGCEVNVSIDGIKYISISLSGSRISSSTDNYCEDNPGVCIGVPVVVAVAVLIILVILLLLFACPDSRRMFLALLHQNSKTSVVSKSNTAENEYVAVTEAPHTNVQPSGESDTISLQNTDTAVAAANERPKYVKVTLSDNLPIHIPPNNLVSYAQIQH
ncbi:uncharacterized protein [Dysidea avara]|uniref:uncharacterized protein isoform X1 n=1 Tax=Dysidea avara TaxID=196820 RepID=UPI00332098BA